MVRSVGFEHYHAEHFWCQVDVGEDVAVDNQEQEPAAYTAPDGQMRQLEDKHPR